ncbi:MAG: murein biosynthesis integral membrane protein MurJ [Actinobacteria bacterium]|nr:murein biosynthesis integral membrane protein MurJ [Actinomycetota bacterium]
MENAPGLLRSNIVVAFGTAMSRITGLARVVVFGVVVGQTALADAYDGANNSPNSVYELLMGGVLAASLVPLFTRQIESEDQEGTEAVFSVSVVFLALITVVSVIAAPLIFRVFSLQPSVAVDATEYRSVGTALARIFLVQIFFYGLTALASALLNAKGKFFAAAWAPVGSNIFTIITLLLINPIHGKDTPILGDVLSEPDLRWLLGIGATGGVGIMAVILMFAARRAGIRLRFRFDLKHPAVRNLTRLSFWTFGYVLANQAAIVVVKNLAHPGSGDQDAYSKAYTFFLMPHGLLAVSLATTFVPELARRLARGDTPGFIQRMNLGLRLTTMLTIPASLILLVLGRPTIGFLLEHGNFTADAVYNTSRALTGFAIGLVSFSLYLFTLRGFYANEDTRTPFFINLIENILNIVLAFFLVDRYGVLGLGLAFAIAYIIASVIALLWLQAKIREFSAVRVLVGFVPMLLAGAGSGVIMWLVSLMSDANGGFAALGRVVAAAFLGSLTYIVLLVFLRVPEPKQMYTQIMRALTARLPSN